MKAISIGRSLAASLVLATMSTVASAAVILNDNGTGWVGKGDVQFALGWNNKQAQDNATKVSFTFEQTTTYSAVCVWTTGEGTKGEKTHDVTHKRSVELDKAVASDPRKTGQYTGYNLLGWGAETSSGSIPVVNGPCPGNDGHEGVYVSVEETSSSPGGLFVNFSGNSVELPITPVETTP